MIIEQAFTEFSEQWPHRPPHRPAHGDAGSHRRRAPDALFHSTFSYCTRRYEEFLEKPRKIYGSVTTFSWLLLQKAKAPFTRSTRAPTYKATEITISNIAQIICCCKANACLCQDIAQALNPVKKKRTNPYKEANEAILHEHTTFQEDLKKAVRIMEEMLNSL